MRFNMDIAQEKLPAHKIFLFEICQCLTQQNCLRPGREQIHEFYTYHITYFCYSVNIFRRKIGSA